MNVEPTATPSLSDDEVTLTDWLELNAFFNEFHVARLDTIDAILGEQAEEHNDDFGESDRDKERIRESIENEIDERIKGCEGAYPFELSNDGEELTLKENWREDTYGFYIACLLTTHLSKKSLLDYDVQSQLIQILRNRIFQVISVFAMAGWNNGSAASIGWPRKNGNTILETLNRAAHRGAGIDPRKAPGKYTAPLEKDGGIDVISWSVEDRPPPTRFSYGQVASGRNWRGKPVSVHVRTFEQNYIDMRHCGDVTSATLIPFRIIDVKTWMSEHTSHGTILDRTRIPKYATKAIQILQNGIEFDEANGLPEIADWIQAMRADGLNPGGR
ncbi:hypothetical protein ATL17_1228 [Maritalea mobilis]|uniref:Uncharacterized protein n=1 Tax=Maritalea mobilis TaxID=483324 RepID=A0A4R6VUQ1_9HYPH|nr:hypothetical protein [Maritalea mobilis]TDQ67221.1 hypothetical protein ATL17_1228 [Maritalea mobilis]